VIMGVAAFAEYFRIFPIIPGRIEQAMRRIEMLFPENGHFIIHHCLFLCPDQPGTPLDNAIPD
jgi:hypothetical protein